MKQLCDFNITFLHFYITSFLFTVEQIKMERISNGLFIDPRRMCLSMIELLLCNIYVQVNDSFFQ